MKQKNRHDPEYTRLINSSRWRKLRLKKLFNDPMCEHCLQSGAKTLATQVHHIVPLETATGASKERLAYDFSNLASLCDQCHRDAHSNRKQDIDRIIKNFYDRSF